MARVTEIEPRRASVPPRCRVVLTEISAPAVHISVHEFDDHPCPRPCRRPAECLQQSHRSVIANRDLRDNPLGWARPVNGQQVAEDMAQSGPLVVVGNRHTNIERVWVTGVPQDSCDTDKSSLVSSLKCDERDMVHPIHRIDEMTQRGSSENARCRPEAKLLGPG